MKNFRTPRQKAHNSGLIGMILSYILLIAIFIKAGFFTESDIVRENLAVAFCVPFCTFFISAITTYTNRPKQ